jgi:ribonucleoside-diphosphate reductase beta chain
MGNIEVIHNNAYEKLLDVLQMQDVFEENLKLDIIQGRVKYLRKYLDKHYKDNRKQYIYSLILFTLYVENVSLFSQFYIINWFNRYKGLLKDTAQQVAYTAKEETLHGLAGVKIVNTIREELPELFEQLSKQYGTQLPSFISLASGPSRTADIEKTLVTGIHGPKEIYCFLLESSPEFTND